MTIATVTKTPDGLIEITRASWRALRETLETQIRRAAIDSPAPEQQELGRELQAHLLSLVEQEARHDALVTLWGAPKSPPQPKVVTPEALPAVAAFPHSIETP